MNRVEGILRLFDKWGFDEKGWVRNTRRLYIQRVRSANDWMQKERGVSILRATPDDYSAYLFSTKPVARNRNNIRQALVAWGTYLVAKRRRGENPARVLPSLREPRRIPQALSAEVAHRIELAVQAFSPEVRALVALYLYGGLRKDEARTLLWSNCDLADGWLRFEGKGGRERAVPMHRQVREALLRWRVECRDAEYVFPGKLGPAGRPVSKTWIFERIAEVGDAAGVHLHPHLLRHTVATALYEHSNGDLRAVQDFLGHADISTTAPYTRVRPPRLAEAMVGLSYEPNPQRPGAGEG
jgi:integrase/recombinase XerD